MQKLAKEMLGSVIKEVNLTKDVKAIIDDKALINGNAIIKAIAEKTDDKEMVKAMVEAIQKSYFRQAMKQFKENPKDIVEIDNGIKLALRKSHRKFGLRKRLAQRFNYAWNKFIKWLTGSVKTFKVSKNQPIDNTIKKLSTVNAPSENILITEANHAELMKKAERMIAGTSDKNLKQTAKTLLEEELLSNSSSLKEKIIKALTEESIEDLRSIVSELLLNSVLRKVSAQDELLKNFKTLASFDDQLSILQKCNIPHQEIDINNTPGIQAISIECSPQQENKLIKLFNQEIKFDKNTTDNYNLNPKHRFILYIANNDNRFIVRYHKNNKSEFRLYENDIDVLPENLKEVAFNTIKNATNSKNLLIENTNGNLTQASNFTEFTNHTPKYFLKLKDETRRLYLNTENIKEEFNNFINSSDNKLLAYQQFFEMLDLECTPLPNPKTNQFGNIIVFNITKKPNARDSEPLGFVRQKIFGHTFHSPTMNSIFAFNADDGTKILNRRYNESIDSAGKNALYSEYTEQDQHTPLSNTSDENKVLDSLLRNILEALARTREKNELVHLHHSSIYGIRHDG